MQRPPPRIRGRRLVLAFLTLAAVIIGLMLYLRLAVQAPPRQLPVLSEALDAPLETESGPPTRLSAFRGRILIVTLFPDGCGGPCEDRNRQLAEIRHYNEPLGDKVQHLTVVQSRAQLAGRPQEARAAQGSSWSWLVADPVSFTQLQQALLPDGAQADLAILDAQGRLRRRFLTTRHSDRPEILLDTRGLLRETALHADPAAPATP